LIYVLAAAVPIAILTNLSITFKDPYLLLIGFPILIVLGWLVAKKTIDKHPTPDMTDEMMIHISGESALTAMQLILSPAVLFGLVLFISGDRWWPWAEPVGLALIIVFMIYITAYLAIYFVKIYMRSRE